MKRLWQHKDSAPEGRTTTNADGDICGHSCCSSVGEMEDAVQRVRDQQVAHMVQLDDLVADLKSELVQKAGQCMRLLDATIATLNSNAAGIETKARALARSVDDRLDGHREHTDRLDREALVMCGDLERNANHWREVLDRTVQGIAVQLDRKTKAVEERLTELEREERGKGDDVLSGGEGADEAGSGLEGDESEKAEKKDERVILNVGGRIFETFRSTLRTYPETLLGAMFSERNERLLRHSNEYFFDRNGDLFASILDFYRHGVLAAPPSAAKEIWEIELDYWNLPLPRMEEEEKVQGKGRGEKKRKEKEKKEGKEEKEDKGGLRQPLPMKIIFDVKPWESDTDLDKLEELVRNICIEGLAWGTSQVLPIAYGINKLRIVCTLATGEMLRADVEEQIQALDDYVQSVDVVRPFMN